MGDMTYKGAGVDIDAGNDFVRRIKPLVAATKTPGVLSGLGGFGGLFGLDTAGMEAPVLVSGTDGVGTKLKLAFDLNKHDTVGIDLVAMCVNDIVVTGAKPLFFLDYFACGKLEVEAGAEVVKGIAEGCTQSGCALIGGETAEMPGFYSDGEYDLAGFSVGVVDRPGMIDGSRVAAGDAVIGLASSGLHSNGFSLARKVFFEHAGLSLTDRVEGFDLPVGETLLTPTKIYVKPLLDLIAHHDVRALAHITGGGITENLPRVLPDGVSVRIARGAWTPLPVFERIQALGGVDTEEMFRAFNMGIGMCAVVSADEVVDAIARLEAAGISCSRIGEVIPGDGEVVYV
ncbi:MAG: phosphoribosylformylglycinamidine cyclo-ligase [Leptospirillia bacterium]